VSESLLELSEWPTIVKICYPFFNHFLWTFLSLLPKIIKSLISHQLFIFASQKLKCTLTWVWTHSQLFLITFTLLKIWNHMMDWPGRQKNTSSQSVRATRPRLRWVCAWALIKAVKRVSDERSQSKICINGGARAPLSRHAPATLSARILLRINFAATFSADSALFMTRRGMFIGGGTSRWMGRRRRFSAALTICIYKLCTEMSVAHCM
jgi:hypothetical protein